ncbi:MAG TPA: hypothetical protein PK535_01550 [Synergistaceae bacterium]|nr:hypothetical protein [Synergistaceae bacterium]
MTYAEETSPREGDVAPHPLDLSPPEGPSSQGEGAEDGRALPPSMEELMSLLHCTREEIEGAVATLGLEDAQARQVLGSLAPTHLAIKGRFFSRKRGTAAGAFCLVAEGRSGTVRDRIIWVGGQDLPQSFSVDAGWEAVRSALLAVASTPDRILLRKIDQVIAPLTGPTELNILFSSPEKLDGFASRFREGLADAFHVDFMVEVRAERFQRGRFEEIFPPEKKEGDPPPKDPLTEEDGASLQIYCAPVIDPVQGRPASLLKLGDMVEVDFDRVAGFGRYVGRLCARTGRVPAFPISRIALLPSGDYLVRLDIADDVIGVMKIPPPYRVRLHVPRRAPVFSIGRNDLRLLLEGGVLVAAMAVVAFAMVYFLLK